MKTQQVQVTAIFEADGKIIPAKFKVNEMNVLVQKILKTYEMKSFGSRYVVFDCLHNGKDNYQLKYDIDTSLWYLLSK